MPSFARWCSALLLLWAGATQAVTIDSLLAQFRALPGLEAHFREEKHLSLLDVPLISEGTIHFAPPSKLARHTLKPVASTLLIDGNQLMFGDSGHSDSIPLDQNPVVRLFVDSFLKLLSGDKKALEQIFTLDLKAHGESWELRLKPKVAPMTQVIESLTMKGTGVVLSQMTIAESTGDTTVTTFDKVDVARHYSAEELARIFALPRP